MNTQESFAFLIDNIFGGLEAASRVGIDCIIAGSKEDQVNSDNLHIKSVNGCNSVYHYLNFLKHLRVETMMNFCDTISQVAPCDLESFIAHGQFFLYKPPV
ncbi:MAG: hypothetical protein PHF97_08435 [Bacteroidales bacterium]|nr:hypothetical protein [Bacteroidales bacterium]MDD4603818.1 hypothetical protein [Bacteroidales bacterium]